MINSFLHKLGIHDWNYSSTKNVRYCQVCDKRQFKETREGSSWFNNVFDRLFPNWFDLL